MEDVIEAGRQASIQKLHTSLSEIIEKYSHPFHNTDVIDLETEEIVEDYGTIRNLEPQTFGRAQKGGNNVPTVLDVLMGTDLWDEGDVSELESGDDAWEQASQQSGFDWRLEEAADSDAESGPETDEAVSQASGFETGLESDGNTKPSKASL
eukprot:TRINITY_DN10566_c0_g2_i2.p1 TRINITY_DN10566_c0_g2~~TRINITY_DN10566_c0_g2_i2.p1  ORF type:complete len:152 (+),score=26.91 TRINITY_DN10566_c0_g2_i2:286-741(+)